MSGSRVVSIIIVALIHVAVGYLLISGLAISAVKEIAERVTTVDIEEEVPEPEEEPPPPPPEEITSPPPPVAPPPPINIAPAPPPIRTQANIPPPAPPALVIPPPAPPAPPPPPPSQARPARPDGQARWQRRIIENYPSRALRREIEGTVGVSVTVNAEGRVAGCRVTRSADPILDEAACDDMTRYARFEPALDAAGNPTTGSWSTNIVYQIN
ncbi:energy transducer TonB [Aurantiacibacter sp. MUD11]|uniref:energy transducer TonB n=1 Tax=Aurantiacibacter sp. MUD11 TaxID=3003265 RepID=UPI0022AB3FC6|nr:energy transducer TonB [Aurantiacibacter sp. MUD11]WAT17297.1 energy transducer TonB [Aurantiacibacter sp. MUD11]